jgi:hypothetical protein
VELKGDFILRNEIHKLRGRLEEENREDRTYETYKKCHVSRILANNDEYGIKVKFIFWAQNFRKSSEKR